MTEETITDQTGGLVILHHYSPELICVIEAPDHGRFSWELIEEIRRGECAAGVALSGTELMFGTKGWGVGRVVYRLDRLLFEQGYVYEGTRIA